MKLLILDNYDSFTYNIVHAVRELGITPQSCATIRSHCRKLMSLTK